MCICIQCRNSEISEEFQIWISDIFYCELGKVLSFLNYFVNQNIHVIITKERSIWGTLVIWPIFTYRMGVGKSIIAIWLDNWIHCMKLYFFFFFFCFQHTYYTEFLSSIVTDYRINTWRMEEKKAASDTVNVAGFMISKVIKNQTYIALFKRTFTLHLNSIL